jgi:glycosyltransferase involved in cell wall biosynthesis
MVVVDDGSTDGTADVVHTLARNDPRIRLVATSGIGRGRALNGAIAESAADLVVNIDADDEAHPYLLRCLLQALDQHPQITVMSTEWIRIQGSAQPDWPEIDLNAPLAVVDVTNALPFYNPIFHSSVMMRKADIVKLGGYDEERRSVFDWDLWVRCAAAGLRLGRVRLPLGAQRIHPGQSYQYSSRLRYLATGAAVQRRAMKALKITPLYLPLIGLRLLWGVLPLRLRMEMRGLPVSRVPGIERLD